MKYILILALFLFFLKAQSQDQGFRVTENIPVYAEMIDTTEVAYRTYLCGGWTFDGWRYVQPECKDSIGVDSFTIIRLYLLINGGRQKEYLAIEEKKYKGVRKAKDERIKFN